MKLKFNHIGIACENISEVIVFLESTFNIVSKSKIIYHENHGVDACLLTNDDGTNIELTDISTADLGNTERVQFSASLDANNLILQATVPSDDWSIRAYVRGI